MIPDSFLRSALLLGEYVAVGAHGTAPVMSSVAVDVGGAPIDPIVRLAGLLGRIGYPDQSIELVVWLDDAWRGIAIPVARETTASQLTANVQRALTTPSARADIASAAVVIAGQRPVALEPQRRGQFWVDTVGGRLWVAAPDEVATTIASWWQGVTDWTRAVDDLPLSQVLPTDERVAPTPPEAWEQGPSWVSSGEDLVSRVHRLATNASARVAVEADDGAWTYADLTQRARRLALALARRHVAPGTRIAVQMPRCRDLPVAWLGVLHAGGAVVPLDPDDASMRAQVLVQASGAMACLALASEVRALSARLGVPVWSVEELIASIADDAVALMSVERPSSPLSEVAVMFTSGSTGAPKGIRIPHRAILRLVDGAPIADLVGVGRRILGFAPSAFDASTFEMWGAIATGGTLCFAPRGPLSLDALTAHLVTARCDVAWLTAGLFQQVMDAGLDTRLGGLQVLLTGGDVVSPAAARQLLSRWPHLRLINGYGPTENTTFTCCHTVQLDETTHPLPIGRPIGGTRVRVAAVDGSATIAGLIGELWTAGEGLALGYVDTPARDAFVVREEGAGPLRWYRTGDLARWRPDGTLAFHGRSDDQVKLGGHRVEPAEVERWLQARAEVRDAAVVVIGDGAMRRLAAAVVLRDHQSDVPDALSSSAGKGQLAPIAAALTAAVEEAFPAWLRPHPLAIWPRLPLTVNGKRDRAAIIEGLAPQVTQAPVVLPPAPIAVTEVQRILASVLGLPSIDATTSFFAMGGTSMAALQAVAALAAQAGLRVSLGDFFDAPTAEGLVARGHATERAARAASDASSPTPGMTSRDGIAIVGMAGRFPGAATAAALWDLACRGGEGVSRFTIESLDPLVPADERHSADYVPVRGVVPEIEMFAAAFFGVPPRQADVMDPQLRVLLELAWEALEQSGHPTAALGERVGVFAGMNHSGYLIHHVLPQKALRHQLGPLAVQFATEKDYVATGIAYRLDLRGPAVSVHTACSTALVAVAQACESLWRGQCDAALAGGVSITVPQRSGHRYEAGGMFSVDGTTRPFDAAATGTVFSDGAGMLVLKRLTDAERDGDTIHAVIRGVAVNNDGGAKASFTAPSVDGQAAVIRQALNDAGWSAADLSFVETHGTATPLGDPIEVEALARVFRADGASPRACALGARKANIGHTTIASGIAGLITAASAVRDGIIPPILHFQTPNPSLGSEEPDFPFTMPVVQQAWPVGRPRRAGVSAFGVGGTNAHVVLEAYAEVPRAPVAPGPYLLPLSAPDSATLATFAERITDSLRDPSLRVDDVAHTLANGRRAMAERGALIVDSSTDRREAPRVHRRRALFPGNPSLVFVCPGQGTQRPGIARDLAATLPVFDDVCRALSRMTGVPPEVESLLYGEDTDDARLALRETALAQPTLVVFQIAMAAQWRAWGMTPTTVLGHSVGELAAAAIAGVLAPADAVAFAARRGAAMQSAPRGRMLAVRADAATISAFLSDVVVWAADNAPHAQTLAGPSDALEAVERALSATGVVTRWLQTSHAFHSPVLADAVEELVMAGVPAVLTTPATAGFISTLTARPEHDALGTAAYWREQALQRVRFREAVIAAVPGAAFVLDLGPGTQVASAMRQTLGHRDDVVIASIGDDAPTAAEGVLGAVAEAWCAGLPVQWATMHAASRGHFVPLPATPLPKSRHWLDAPTSVTHGLFTDDAGSASALERQRILIAHQLDFLHAHD